VARGLIGQVPVDEARLESQRMVVMGEQRFFFFDTEGNVLFPDVAVSGEQQAPLVYTKGQQVLYVTLTLKRRNATVVSVDFDGESTVPFYTVEFGDGGPPRQTTADKLEPLVRCRPSTVVFLPYSVARDVAECKRLLEAGEAGKDGVLLGADVKARVEKCLEKRLDSAWPWLGEKGHSVAHCRGIRDGACSCGDNGLPVYVHEAALHKFASEAFVNDKNGLELVALALRSCGGCASRSQRGARAPAG